MKNISFFFTFLFTVLATNSSGQVRPDLASFSSLSRDTLVDLMQQYITADIIEWHCDFRTLTSVNDLQIHDDFNFLPFHRAYMEGMEDFLILNGKPHFVPLPAWDPNTPTPLQFQLVDADCMLTSCNINVGNGDPAQYCDDNINWNPSIDRSDYLELNNLCVYGYDPPSPPSVPYNDDEDELSRTLEAPYHNDVHINMDGNMFSFASPSSPIFWNWHAYLDDMWKDWECNCPQSTVADVDLYLKDNTKIMMHTRDVGEEPNIGPIWESGDIWVRKQQDGFTTDTNDVLLEYISPTDPLYVYVRVRNRGCIPSAGTETLFLHWSKGETPLTWPDYWDGSTSNGIAVMGNQISSTQTIPVIAAQSSKILEFQWFPPNPDDYPGNSDPNNFRLLARQVSSNDPMTFTEVSAIEDNIDFNNNIAGKDITIENNQLPLPIELTSFSGERVREEIQLSWETSSEIQNKGFEIYRSSNNSTWEKLGWVDGNGSSIQQYVYAFDDTKPAYGINYYRLKQIDFDGAFEYSEIIAIENDRSDFKIQVFPNPSSRNFNIRIANPLLQKMKIQINDNLGMKIWESNLIVGESGWSNELEIERNGIYLITVQLGNEIYYERIVILGK